MRATSHTTAPVHGSALVMVLIFSTLTLIILAGIAGWSTASTTLSQRQNQYFRTVAAAEAATEKVLSHITADYQTKGEARVLANLDSYRALVPSQAEDPFWRDYMLTDNAGTPARTQVDFIKAGGYRVLAAPFRGLRGFSMAFRIVSHAREINSPLHVKAAVQQDIEVATIPVFQFAIFYNLDLEINPAPPMLVSGLVHCNQTIYVQPHESLVFEDDVTAAREIIHNKKPQDPLERPSVGIVVFQSLHESGASELNLPIGDNSPDVVHEIIEVPPILESPGSSLGQQRYYNKADLIVRVSDADIRAGSGLANGFSLTLPAAEVAQFLNTSKTFFNKRENKTVKVVELDLAKLRQWNQTNSTLRKVLPAEDIQTIFIADERFQGPSTQSGVRLVNGQTILPKGLTVATPNPIYIQGHYNAPASDLGTARTRGALPASVVADAITILSVNWDDANSSSSLGARTASDTTVNAAFLAGIVETVPGAYSGGVENFPRFLEDWGGSVFTYNGSMVVMFQSEIATAPWAGGDVYSPPHRNWSFDKNFEEAVRLPPATPSLRVLVRGAWTLPRAL